MSEINPNIGFRTHVCCSCFTSFAVTDEFDARRREDRELFYCPMGHRMHYLGEREVDKLKRELVAKQARLDQARADAAATRRQLSAQRGVTTRIKRRVGNGVCPCCKRTFQQLARHMAGQHPDFNANSEASK